MKPRIVIVADVRGWAWERKAIQLQHHLADEFDLRIVYQYAQPADLIPTDVDLVHTFEVMQPVHLGSTLPFVTGITAHVWDGHIRNHGRSVLRDAIGRARAFHANSVMLVEDTGQRWDLAARYCPNGVDETFFRRLRPRTETQRLVVGWVGKPNPRKGGDVVKAACELAGVELRTVERRHTNALPAEAMRDFYQDCHVVVVASDMDGTPNHALEGAACGCAVVSNRIGNMPQFIDQGMNGILVERSAASMAKALAMLACDLPRTITMGEAARATIEHAWTWRELSRNYAAMWRASL